MMELPKRRGLSGEESKRIRSMLDKAKADEHAKQSKG